MLNKLRSGETGSESRKLYLLDVDCGQPTFNLPGTVALLECVQEGDFATLEPQMVPVSETFINSANPATDPSAYLSVIESKLRVYSELSSKNKRLVVNTCGWVEGLGAEIQLRIINLAR